MEISKKKLYLTLNHVKDILENKTTLNRISRDYLGIAKEYFTNAKRSIDSMLNVDDNKGYYITPHSVEVFVILNENIRPKQAREIEDIGHRLEFIISSLDKIKKTPAKFYRTEDSKIMLGHFNNLVNEFKPAPQAYDELDGDD